MRMLTLIVIFLIFSGCSPKDSEWYKENLAKDINKTEEFLLEAIDSIDFSTLNISKNEFISSSLDDFNEMELPIFQGIDNNIKNIKVGEFERPFKVTIDDQNIDKLILRYSPDFHVEDRDREIVDRISKVESGFFKEGKHLYISKNNHLFGPDGLKITVITRLYWIMDSNKVSK